MRSTTSLELTIAKNDAEALVGKLRSQMEQQSAGDDDPDAAGRVLGQAKAEARRILAAAQRQAETTVKEARAAAQREIARVRENTNGVTTSAVGAPQDITRLLEIAERFETELTKIAKGALGDVGTIAKQLRRHLDTPAAAPSPTEPVEQRAQPKRRSAPAAEGSSTLDLLRRKSAEQRDGTGETSLAAELADDAKAQEEARALAERLVAQRAMTAAAESARPSKPTPTAHQVDDAPRSARAAPGESTSLASRIARERGETATDDKKEVSDRGSFYSRRSARLPRIGDTAAAGALAAVKSVRKNGEGDDFEEDAAQTA